MSDAYVPPEPSKMAIPPVESPFLKEFLKGSDLDDATKQQALFYAENGYLILDLELPDFDTMCERMIRDLAEHYPKVQVGRRIDEAWYYNEDVRKLAAAPKVLEVLQLLYQRRAFPFQTLNFDVGTEQPAHSDTIHFHCMPRRYMVGVWAPLEDVDADCGTLFVVPGSHKLPDYDMSELGLLASSDSYRSYEDLVKRILEVSGLESQIVELKRGQAVIWSANLFHGGSPRLDPKRTRHSQATHYYFEDCMYYMPMESDTFGGSICYREAIDIGTGRMVEQTFRGQPLDLSKQKKVFRYARPLPKWVTGASRSLKDRIIG